MKETIYNLPNEEYHRGEEFKDYISSTQLKDYEISPKFAKFKRENPLMFQIGKDAREKGSLYHNCLESIVNTGSMEKFKDSIVIFENPINKSTGQPYGVTSKAYSDAYEFFQSENKGKELVSKSDLDLIKLMIDELLSGCGQTSKDVRDLIKWGKAEVSHFVEFEGSKFKYRPDLETKKKIVDWKTVAVDDLHEATINKIISKFNYDISAAFYQFFEFQRTGIWKSFYWVFQQKSPPYDAILASADNWAFSMNDEILKLGSGALKFKYLLRQHVYCNKTNNWDGAQIFLKPGFLKRRIMYPNPPGYEINNLFTFYN